MWILTFRDGDKENDSGDVLKAVDPLFALRSLTSDVEKLISELADLEGGLGDASGLDARTQDVLIGRHVVGLANALNGIKVAGCQQGTWVMVVRESWLSPVDSLRCRVIDLQLVPPRKGLLDAFIMPERINGIDKLGRHPLAFNLRRGVHDQVPSALVLGVDGNLHLGDTFKEDADT